MAYASIDDVKERMTRPMSPAEESACATLLDDAAIIVDAYNCAARGDAKRTVSCRMVIRALGDGEASGYPMGATQGSMSGLGYSQSWTIGGGSGGTGEIYLSKMEKKLLGVGDQVGSHSPVEDIRRHWGVPCVGRWNP